MIYNVVISAVFGGVDEVVSFINEDEANQYVLDWANQNRPDWGADSDESFADAYDAIKWFEKNDGSVDYVIQMIESDLRRPNRQGRANDACVKMLRKSVSQLENEVVCALDGEANYVAAGRLDSGWIYDLNTIEEILDVQIEAVMDEYTGNGNIVAKIKHLINEMKEAGCTGLLLTGCAKEEAS